MIQAIVYGLNSIPYPDRLMNPSCGGLRRLVEIRFTLQQKEYKNSPLPAGSGERSLENSGCD
jgi:hypothetical protein